MRLVRKIASELGLNDLESGIDVVGTIAIVKFPPVEREKKAKIAERIMEEMKNVKTVLEQEGPVDGEFRTRKLGYVAGIDTRVTTHKENGIILMVDVERCYFSPRLSTERLRIASLCKENETVLNMFAGVGPFSILIAKKARASVTSIELNKVACFYHARNCKLNKVSVDILNSDSRFSDSFLRQKYERIIMPFPSKSNLFLCKALSLLREGGTIHYYRHVKGKNEGEAKENLEKELQEVLPRGEWKIRKVRDVGLMTYELVADIVLR